MCLQTFSFMVMQFLISPHGVAAALRAECYNIVWVGAWYAYLWYKKKNQQL